MHTSILKALRNLHKETCLILFNLEQCFPDFNVHMIHLGVLLKFWSWIGPSFYIFQKIPSSADAAGLRTTL